MARQPGARTQMLVAFETTYGTAPASGWLRVPFASVGLSAEQPLIDNELLGYGRDPLAPVKDAITADGSVAVPVDLRAMGHWLRLMFGSPVTTGAEAPYTHVFKTGSWVLPSMAIEVQMPQVPRFAMYTGVKADTLSWTMQRSGLLTATLGLVAQKETAAAETAAGSPADIALTRFGHFVGSISRDASPLGSIVSAEVNFANNLDRIEVIRGDGAIDGADASIGALTGSLVARLADATLLDQAIAGSPCALSFAYSLGAGQSLTVTAHEVYLPRPRLQVDGPQGVQATFDWQAALNTSATCMATITLVNDVAAYA